MSIHPYQTVCSDSKIEGNVVKMRLLSEGLNQKQLYRFVFKKAKDLSKFNAEHLMFAINDYLCQTVRRMPSSTQDFGWCNLFATSGCACGCKLVV